MCSKVALKIDLVAPSLHHHGDSIRGQRIILPLAALEQEMFIFEFRSCKVLGESRLDFLVHYEDVLFASFLFLEADAVANLAILHV